MTDGAHLHIKAEDSMKTIVGAAEQPESMTPEDFEVMIREAPLDAGDYNGGANAMARLILETYEHWPNSQNLPEENDYLRLADGNIDWSKRIKANVSLWDVLKQLYPEHEGLFEAMTGFMWGWAINAARAIKDLGPVPNPAIVQVAEDIEVALWLTEEESTTQEG